MNNVKKYAPNSVRPEIDDDVMRWGIYLNHELEEICPVSWTKEQAEERLQELVDKYFEEIEPQDPYDLDFNLD